MNTFIYCVEGIDKKVEVAAENQKEAHKLAWETLTTEEKNRTVCLDLVDTY